jgi:SAM-dependent methyltransferase
MSLMRPNKLNFGCGNRYSPEWVNIDFHSESKQVQRVNLLNGFPFPDSSFEAVYSSHVLEHFDRHQGGFLISESFRVLTRGGILRIVVPDLEGSVREYLRVLSMPDSPDKNRLYSWAVIELLDQLVRNKSTGEMGPYLTRVFQGNNEAEKHHIKSRTQNTPWHSPSSLRTTDKLKTITAAKIKTKCTYFYLHALSKFIPPSLRDSVFVQTGIGERHRWMYDAFSLKQAFESAGFSNVKRLAFNESAIDKFASYGLDSLSDNEPYKNNSVYMEGLK